PRGWALFTARFAMRAQSLGFAPDTLWQGQKFAGQRLFVRDEHEGYGDRIFAVRYLPLVKASGGTVVLQVRPELARVLTGQPGVDATVPSGHTPAYDWHVPLFSLPCLFPDTMPPSPYLTADPELVETWRARVDRRGDLTVGIVWAGNHRHVIDHR